MTNWPEAWCPHCRGPATVTTNWRGDRIGECAAYNPCRGDWEPGLQTRRPYRWYADAPSEPVRDWDAWLGSLDAWRKAAA